MKHGLVALLPNGDNVRRGGGEKRKVAWESQHYTMAWAT